MLEITNLSIVYGSQAVLRDVSLQVAAGEVVALVGPNGAGKTTLLRAINGALKPAVGTIRIQEQDATRLSALARARLMAVVPQARSLPEAFTVWQTVLLGRTPHIGWLGKTTESDMAQVQQALTFTDTLGLAKRRLGELSGGEQQRVLVARALAQETPLLLLDEPTAHLDIHHQSGVLNLVRSLARERGKAVLMALHDLTLAGLYADRVALLTGGRVRAQGLPTEVLTAPLLAEAYSVTVQVLPHPQSGAPLILPEYDSVRDKRNLPFG